MIAVVDYDAGNLHSISKAILSLGCEARVTSAAGEVEAADAVVLPGVGAFGDCLGKLRSRGLAEPIRRFVASGRPFLGICVGLQALFEGSDESPGEPGLGVLPGRVRRLRARTVPQMGWNALEVRRPGCPLLRGLGDGDHFYFVHSYHAVPEDAGLVVAAVDYEGPVTAVVARDNLFGVQFHPEKSSRAGLRLLANFAALSGGHPGHSGQSGGHPGHSGQSGGHPGQSGGSSGFPGARPGGPGGSGGLAGGPSGGSGGLAGGPSGGSGGLAGGPSGGSGGLAGGPSGGISAARSGPLSGGSGPCPGGFSAPPSAPLSGGPR
jgi:glutamine amidotransferase